MLKFQSISADENVWRLICLPVLRSAEGVEGKRGVFGRTILPIMLVLAASAVTGWAQVRSNAASVTLYARIEESFSLQHLVVPTGQSFVGDSAPAPQALLIGLGWTLRHAREFKVGFRHLRPADATSPASGYSLMSLRQLSVMPQVFSFMPMETSGPPVLGAWGDNEEDPVGQASLLMALPRPDKGEAVTVLISVVIL